MRLYSFQNMYFAGIHAGIQTAHSIAEMFIKYPLQSIPHIALESWASDHKTIIVKNGGMAGDLRNLITLLEHDDNQLAWSPFYESEYAADGCLTNVSVVVPTYMWMIADIVRKDGWLVVDPFDDVANTGLIHISEHELRYLGIESPSVTLIKHDINFINHMNKCGLM